ncbi:hypothetical protein HYC85_013139 [Camellia sinensis]|uniref:Uncharacterized protein n=1 Tax=Camellia sinensis TaxID=4442 RepID=A0A7J7H2J7_CAMSI|nr:hypothetical protein HYC85_013139 [Camellia sinensis]
MSGEAAVDAKNVMLPASEPTMPRLVRCRQLFTQPHPARQAATRKSCNTTAELNMIQFQVNQVQGEKSLILETAHLQGLEDVAAFCEHAQHFSPPYCYHLENLVEDDSSSQKLLSDSSKKNISGTPDHGSKHELQSRF